jgi:hypothetical protein
MHCPASVAVAVCAAVAGFAVSSAQAQVAQAPLQLASPSSPASTSSMPFFASGSPLVPGWSFSFAPYAWLSSIRANIDTRTPGGGRAETDIYASFGDVVDHLRFVGMAAAEVRYDRFSILTDFMYMNLGMSRGSAHLAWFEPGPGGRIQIPVEAQTSASTGMGTTIWTLAAGYTLSAGPWGNIDAIAGARLLAVDVTTNYTLTADIGRPGGIVLAKNGSLGVNAENWDAIVGVTGRFDIPNSNFFVPYYFDVGTGDLPLTWEAFSGLGYHTAMADYSLGYRYLAFENNSGATLKKLEMGGLMAAATFHF